MPVMMQVRRQDRGGLGRRQLSWSSQQSQAAASGELQQPLHSQAASVLTPLSPLLSKKASRSLDKQRCPQLLDRKANRVSIFFKCLWSDD